ncbi:MarR family winged helix-turn-helix transcriptional regulator [Flavimaricola marinus]|uniref:MarR family protein n=1 Tax=Flavimaricola marinus TaxID=1819565 RepID=A0A238LGP2_9RHOB|nr:MarR family winged helix-turn-helix transcriptional regulator [Flavimaricola marinus]SMY08859.1 MarR family protein [Flavimaricola marinus]
MDDQAQAGSIRISEPTCLRDGHRIIDIRNYAPFLLNATSNAWQRRTAADYRERFGIGIVEWRILSMLNIEPGITASRVCDVIRMDKSAASRTLSDLNTRGLLCFEASEKDTRKRRWWLSDDGRRKHDEVLSAALEHEGELVQDIDPEDFEIFLKVIRQMLRNLDPRD